MKEVFECGVLNTISGIRVECRGEISLHNYDFTMGFERTIVKYEKRIKNKRDKNEIRIAMQTYVHIH